MTVELLHCWKFYLYSLSGLLCISEIPKHNQNWFVYEEIPILLTPGASTLPRLTGSSTSLTKLEARGRSGSSHSVDSTGLKYGSEMDIAMRSIFDQVSIDFSLHCLLSI